MQLVTFEAMLVDRLNATGKAQAKSFQAAAIPALYGVVVQVDGAVAPFRLTRGSGTGDPPMTDDERALHEANVARLEGSKAQARYTPQQHRKAEDLIRDVLAADPPPTSVLVEGPADGRERPGVKVRFVTGAEIYAVPTA